MAKAGTINEVIDIKAVEAQFSTIDKLIDALVVKIEGLNKALANLKVPGGAQQQNTAQKEANRQAQEAVSLTAKLTEEELKAARARQEKAARTKMANDAAKEEINLNADVVGAYKAMSTELDKLRKQYKDLAASGKANTEEGKKLLKTVQDLDGNIKKLDASVGQHQRNVGNYGSALDRLGGTFASMPGPIGQVGSSIQGVTKLMLANPIVLLITAITYALVSLVAAFKSTDDGATLIEARWQQLKSILTVLTTSVADFASGLKMLWNGEFKAGWAQMTGAFDGIGDAMAGAANAAWEYIYAMDTINDRITAFISQEAQLKNEIAKLLFVSKDQTKSEKERQAALEEAMKKERELSNFKVETAQQTYDATVKKIAAEKRVNVDMINTIIKMDAKQLESAKEKGGAIADAYNMMGDSVKELEKLYADAINADTEFFETQKRTQSQLTGFRQQAHEKYMSNMESESKKLDELNKKIYQWMNQFIPGDAGAGRMTPKGTPSTVSTPGKRTISQTPTKVSPDGGFPSEILTGADYEKEIQSQLSKEAEVWNQRLSIAADTLAKIDGLVNQSFANRFSQIDIEAQKDEEAKQKELKLAGDNATKKEDIEKKYAAKEAEREKERRRLQKEQAKYQKNAALIQSIVNTAVGVTGAVAATPGPVGIVMAALVLALGIAQTAMIASQPLPSYAKGRKGGKAELANINERGQEAVVTRSGEVYFPQGPLAYLPEGSSVIPNHELVDMAGRSATTRGLPDWTATDTNLSLRNEVNGLHRGFAMLAREIRDKKETHINITEKGIWAATSRGNVYEEWINQHIRL